MILYYRHDNQHGATLVCQALGYKTGYHYRDPGGTGPIFGDKKNILCKGGEATVWDCPTPGKLDCNHDDYAGASCIGTDLDILENNPHTLQIHGSRGSIPEEGSMGRPTPPQERGDTIAGSMQGADPPFSHKDRILFGKVCKLHWSVQGIIIIILPEHLFNVISDGTHEESRKIWIKIS